MGYRRSRAWVSILRLRVSYLTNTCKGFRSLGMHFYRGADAVVLVFSILDRNTLEHVASWSVHPLIFAY